MHAKQLLQVAFALTLCLTTLPTPAHAFVRSRTRSCRTIFWPQSCLYIQPDGDLLGDDMPAADVLSAINSAIGAWNDHLNIGSFMQLRYLPPDGPKQVNPLDGLQLIKFHRDRFCRPITATDSSEMCLDPSATAVTTVTFISRPSDPATDGLIIDADIDLNAVDFQFYNGDNPAPLTTTRAPIDLWNTLTHEMGHMMGLEHPCTLAENSLAACVVDDQNRPVPDCSVVDMNRITDQRLQTIYEATMYPSANPGETSKRTPHADDVAGILDAYPKVHDPLTCKLPFVVQSAGCTTSAGRTAAPTLFAVAGSLALAGALGWRRRRRRRARATPS